MELPVGGAIGRGNLPAAAPDAAGVPVAAVSLPDLRNERD